MEKAKIVEEIKPVNHEQREKSKVLVKRDLASTSSNFHPINLFREGRLQTRGAVTNSRGKVFHCKYCGNYHLGDCRKKMGVCLKCRLMEHLMKDCSRSSNQAQTSTQNQGVG